jgi:hypothetical protein
MLAILFFVGGFAAFGVAHAGGAMRRHRPVIEPASLSDPSDGVPREIRIRPAGVAIAAAYPVAFALFGAGFLVPSYEELSALTVLVDTGVETVGTIESAQVKRRGRWSFRDAYRISYRYEGARAEYRGSGDVGRRRRFEEYRRKAQVPVLYSPSHPEISRPYTRQLAAEELSWERSLGLTLPGLQFAIAVATFIRFRRRLSTAIRLGRSGRVVAGETVDAQDNGRYGWRSSVLVDDQLGPRMLTWNPPSEPGKTVPVLVDQANPDAMAVYDEVQTLVEIRRPGRPAPTKK